MRNASGHKRLASFKPCLEPLEDRCLLNGNLEAPQTPEEIEAAFETIETLSGLATDNQNAGQSEQSSNTEVLPVTELRNNWNTFVNDVTDLQVSKLPQDAKAVKDTYDQFAHPDPVDIALKQASQLPPGFQRGLADTGMVLQGGFVAVGGALTFQRDIFNSGIKEISGAFNDYGNMLKQAWQQFLQGNFSLSSPTSQSQPTGGGGGGSHLTFTSTPKPGAGTQMGAPMFVNVGALTLK